MTRHPRPDRRTLLAGTGFLTLSGVLAACAPSEDTPPAASSGASDGTPTPNLRPEQIERVVGEIVATVAEADKAKDAAALAPRVTGSAAAFRTAAYAAQKAEPELASQIAGQLVPPSSAVFAAVPTLGTGFPRSSVVLTGDASDQPLTFLQITQEDARAPYTTWGWAVQMPGVPMPRIAPEGAGAEAVPPDADDLLMTPTQALAHYAKVLSDGAAADPRKQLAADPYLTAMHKGIQDERAQLNRGVEQDQVATIREVYTPVGTEQAAVRTTDGGAIVMGTFTSVRRLAVKPGATVGGFTVEGGAPSLPAALTGRTEFTREFVRDYGTTVALHVPPRSASGGKIQPIAALRHFLRSSGS
ncbi:hypothetical protein JSY14_02305 [Brachybacterium sp. EF45031]|uniref:hypothetical protein n=1 Tax=Brachybacterium sillae TaxID=2810536 RepID=UPI00217CDA4A|nr:hypothetical protein [Brachybacterium sillae]MCS6710906.1 hypothetical protein [Brachybacterium sillae]